VNEKNRTHLLRSGAMTALLNELSVDSRRAGTPPQTKRVGTIPVVPRELSRRTLHIQGPRNCCIGHVPMICRHREPIDDRDVSRICRGDDDWIEVRARR
jgi:hypothetical protein